MILSLAGLSFHVARRSTRSTDQALLMSVLLSTVDRASTIHFDSLSTLAGCDTTVSGVVLIIDCTTVTAVTNVRSDVRIAVRTTVPGARPDTILIQRARVRYPVPLR